MRLASFLMGALFLLTSDAIAQNSRQPLSQEQVRTSGQQGAELGSTINTKPLPDVIEGVGERQGGQAVINGQSIDINKLLPGADANRAQRLMNAYDKGKDFTELKSAVDEAALEERYHKTNESAAMDTVNKSARKVRQFRALENDSVIANSREFIHQGREGNVLGEVFADCTTITDTTGGIVSWTTSYDETCERIVPPSEDPVCTREYIVNPFNLTTDQDRRETLNIPGEGINGEVCRQQRTVNTSRELLSLSKAGDLDISEAIDGLSCTRSRWADAEVASVHLSKDSLLPVNDEIGGLSCTRERWFTQGAGGGGGNERTATLEVGAGANDPLICLRQRWPVGENQIVNETMDATLNVNRESQNDLVCERWRWPSTTTGSSPQSYSSDLEINTEQGGLSCSRSIVPTASVVATNQQFDATLSIDNQSGGNVCKRTVWPTSSSSSTNQTKSGSLSVNTEATGTLSCTIARTASTGTNGQSNSQTASLSVNNEVNGEVCSRNRTVTSSSGSSAGGPMSITTSQIPSKVIDFAAFVPSNTTSMTSLNWSTSNYCWSADMTSAPTAANAWKGVFEIFKTPAADDPGCSSAGVQTTIIFTWSNSISTLNFGLDQTGNCNDSGTADCPTSWSCLSSAPTSIGGVSVSASDVGGLPLLYPGATNTCVSGSLRRTCNPSTTGNNILLNVGGGVSSISNFSFSVTNPQPGITVTLASSPTQANGFTATFNVSRTDFSYSPAAPSISMSWIENSSILEFGSATTGNCNDPGSTSCPTQWSCTRSAPGIVDGINISASQLSGVPPLYSGASSSCLNANLARTCAGGSSTGSSIGIGDVIPGGTTSITNFTWAVTNPQSGVSVSLVAAPSMANGWTASFNVTRTNWSVVPASPQITMNWTVPSTTTSISIVDTGDCAQPGTTNCPAVWSCEGTAPQLINGINVTATMAAPVVPIYTGANNSCLRASKDKSCSGSAIGSNSVNISAQIPSGVTSIRNFAHVVSNPQSGVSVNLVSAPSQANGWIATFNVVRTIFTVAHAAPQVRLTWIVDVPTTTTSITDSGNCGDPGSSACPTQWSCTNSAPMDVNGTTLTLEMAQSRAPLFPGAPNNCAVGSLNRVCSGASVVGSTIGIGHIVPASARSITGFTWGVTNIQNGVSVSLVSEPSFENGWTAYFNVTRASWVSVPNRPNIVMNWSVSTSSTGLTVEESGNCGATPSNACAHNWSCTQSAPATVNEILITESMASSATPALFNGAAALCIRGELRKSCTAPASNSIDISIASNIPDGTQSIVDFDFDVINNQSNVDVELIQTPALANNWVARFRVTRTSFDSVPDNPRVSMRWGRSVPASNTGIRDTGDCDAPVDERCSAAWNCTQEAPLTINGVLLTPEIVRELPSLFDGASDVCVVGERRSTCVGSERETQVSIADLIEEGAISINGFDWEWQNRSGQMEVQLVSAPALSNNWVATFRVRLLEAGETERPIVRLFWNQGDGSVVASIRDTGDCNDPGSAHCPTGWTCTGTAPATVNGIEVTEAMVQDLPRLFPDAAPVCIAGELKRTCVGAVTQGATISIAELIPEGATSIRNLTVTVLNPQSTVTVTKTTDPTFANGWVVSFEIVRTDLNTPVEPPNVRVEFDVDEASVVLTVRDEGDCSDPGSVACPTAWSCSTMAPTTINGINITASQVQNEPLLFPGASNVCVIGELRRTCASGTQFSAQIPIGELLPDGTQEILNFAWEQTNPIEGMTVLLSSEPSLENGWVATFSVSSSIPVTDNTPRPHIAMEWNVMGPVQYEHSVVTIGDCQIDATDTCAHNWVCLSTLPTTINGVEITQALLQSTGGLELFPNEQMSCAEAALVRVCTGTGSDTTIIDISEQIPEDTHEILNYTWVVSREGAGIGVEEVEAPTESNQWKAIFRTIVTDGSVPHTHPEVYLKWQIEVDASTVQLVETGDCTVTGDEFCGTEWVCRAFAPGFEPDDDPSGPPGGGGNQDEGSVGEKIIAVRIRPPPGEVETMVRANIVDEIPPGTEEISNFRVEVVTGSNIDAYVIREPSMENSWTAVIGITSNDESNWDGSSDQPSVRLVWNNGNVPPGDNGGPIGTGGSGGLYAGAPRGCTRAELVYDCSGINNGEVCHDTANGPVCEIVEGGLFDNCEQLEGRQDCEFVESICNEDGRGDNGHCYLETDVYRCRRIVTGDGTSTETTSCTGMTVTCLDGSCTNGHQNQEQTNARDISKSMAVLAVQETLVSDYYIRPLSGGAGGTGGTGDDGSGIGVNAAEVGVSERKASGNNMTQAKNSDPILPDPTDPRGGGEWDPWALPDGAEEEANEDDLNFGDVPAGFDPSRLEFLKGKSMNCMKALGGLLNCCTPVVAPDKTNKKWWELFRDRMRNQWTSVAQCAADGNATPGSHADMIAGAGNASLNGGFTSMFENLAGGGTPLTCGSMPSMESVNNEFMDFARGTIRPNLSWYCDEDEFDLATMKEIGNCSYLGDYCATSIFGVCIDKRQRHCCFNSPMTKMLREHLKTKGIGMGTAKNPQCKGISVQDMMRLNLAEMDTSDLEGRIVEAGVMPDLMDLANQDDLEFMTTGAGSRIGIEDRQTTSERTEERLADTDVVGATHSIEDSILPLIETEEEPPPSFTVNHVTFENSYLPVKVGKSGNRHVVLKIKRSGYGTMANAQLRLNGGTAQIYTDFAGGFPVDLSWGTHNTSTKTVSVWIYPKEQTGLPDKSIKFALVSPDGSATISPHGTAEIIIDYVD